MRYIIQYRRNSDDVWKMYNHTDRKTQADYMAEFIHESTVPQLETRVVESYTMCKHGATFSTCKHTHYSSF